MKIAIIGKGAWGQGIGSLLERNGHSITYIERGESWPKELSVDWIFVALPCQVLRERFAKLELPLAPLVSLTKGIEIETGLTASELLQQILPKHKIVVVSGPSLAHEVAEGRPTVVVAASHEEDLARQVQILLRSRTLRVYRSQDTMGVELGGALKNVYAIAAGMAEGLNVGENGKAALVTRSLAEMVRLSAIWEAKGAKKETFFGLSGMGDLVLTAYSGHSRNHQVGLAIAQGKDLQQALNEATGVAEGVFTTRALYEIVKQRQMRAPILTEIYRVLYEKKSPQMALNDLMTREVEHE